MHNHVKVEFLPSRLPASDETVARRTDAVRRLDDAGHIDAGQGGVNTTETRWVARVGAAEMEALDFSVQKLDDGRVAVSLVAVVDAVSIGDQEDPGYAMQTVPADEEEDPAAARRRVVEERLAFAERPTTMSGLSTPGSHMETLSAQVARNAEAQV